MITLEQILTNLGATLETQDVGKAFVTFLRSRLAPELGEAEASKLLIDTDASFLKLGDALASSGRPLLAAEAYGLLVDSEPDAEALGKIGFLLLQRSGSTDLPVCDTSYGTCIFELGGQELALSGPNGPNQAHPVLDKQPSILHAAVKAFGRAWLSYHNLWLEYFEGRADSPDVEHQFRELLALDGLRSAFAQLDYVEFFEPLESEYNCAAEDWESQGGGAWEILSPIDTHFRESAAYVRGRTEGSSKTTAESAEEWLKRRRDWQTKVSQLFAELKANSDQATEERVAEFCDIVDQLIAPSLDERVAVSENRLRTQLGETWTQLPREVQRLLLEAEYLRPSVAKRQGDWSPVAIFYAKSVEFLLQMLAPYLEKLGIRPRDSRSWSTAGIAEFQWLLTTHASSIKPASGRPDLAQLIALIPALEKVRSIRVQAAHRAGPVDGDQARLLRKTLFADRLIERLASVVLQ